MSIWFVVVVIAIISFILSLISLRNLKNKAHLDEVKKKLDKGRVIFQDTSSSSKS